MSKKIYINPGHSDRDPGAVSYEIERRLNVRVALLMDKYLLANYECESKITPGNLYSLTAICKHANDYGADLFVSIHFNAGGGDGYEALVYSQNRVPLGRIFEKHVKAAGQNSRGVKIRPNLAVLKNTNMPAILNEGAFVDNKKDIQDWNEEAELKKLGIAYAEAVAEFLNLPKKKVAKPANPVKKSVDEIAKEVLNGKWGNGVARKQALTKAGYDYNAVQKKVTELCKPASSKKSVDEIAKEVLNGKWGNGVARKQALTKAGYDYDAVQKKVTELCKGV